MECILYIVRFLCGRFNDGLGGAVQAQAEGGFSFLGGLVGRALLDRVREWRNRVIPQPTDTTTLVGAEENLKTIHRHLLGNEVDVVGIVGMGGVGKTTLLKKINNDFYSGGAGNFNVVMFVTVSSEGDVLNVQKQIAERLGLSVKEIAKRLGLPVKEIAEPLGLSVKEIAERLGLPEQTVFDALTGAISDVLRDREGDLPNQQLT